MRGYTQYDTLASPDVPSVHSDEQHQQEYSGSAALIFKPNDKFTNRIIYSKYDIDRVYNKYDDGQDGYYGYRNALTYSGNYNIDLDSSIIFGVDTEFDQLENQKSLSANFQKECFQTDSVYFDYQKRFSNNIFATFGSRFDDNSVAGTEEAHRASLAYLFDDKSTKIKSSYGTGFRFPSLYELNFLNSYNNSIKAERNVLKVLEGDCETAVGAFATIVNDKIKLEAELFSLDGKERFYCKSSKDIKQAAELGIEIGENLKKQSKGNYKK